jgi:hypothetical protein
MEFISFRGKNLEATIITVAGQEFLIAAVGDRADSAIADTYAQQQEIEIVPGLKIKEKKSGQEFKILSKPIGYCNLVEIQDIHHFQLSTHIAEDELRQNFRFVG